MRKLFYIFCFLLTVFNTTAWGDDTKTITVEWTLRLPDRRYNGGYNSGLYVYDQNEQCTIKDQIGTNNEKKSRHSGIDFLTKKAQGETKLLCPKNLTNLTLVFDFNGGKGTVHTGLAMPWGANAASFTKTFDISKKKKIKIDETIETVSDMQTRLMKEIGETYCKDNSWKQQNSAFCCLYGYKNNNTSALQTELDKIAGRNMIIINDEICKSSDSQTTITDSSTVVNPQSNSASSTSRAATASTGSTPSIDITWPIRGTVFDNNGDPLIGANVIIPDATFSSGTPCGAAADSNGQFSIAQCATMPSNPELQITYMGYAPQKISLSSFKNNNRITLSEDSQTLSGVVVTACQTTDPNYPGATDFARADDGNCYPSECNEPAYKLTGESGTQNARCESQKCDIKHAITTYWETNDMRQWVCIADDCAQGYKPNDDKTSCTKMLKKCTDEQNRSHPNASETGIKEGTNPEQCIALECKCGYDLVNEECVAWPATGKNCTADTKPALPNHATGATMQCNAKGKAYCQVTGCESNYTENDDKTKCETLKGECTHTDPNVKKAKYKKVNGNRICVITKCNDGYMPSEDGQKCEVSEGPCNETQLATVENATKGELKKGKCRATECKPGYEVEKHKCVEIAGNCPDKPENAKKSHREFDSNTQAEVCIIDECKDGYKVSDDSKSCIEIEKPKLSREDSQKKIDELQENATAMKDKEQSTENKLLGGAAIGATGIGGMQLASGAAEMAADEDAEQAMRAYLATFHCNYGGGINVKGGEKDVQLPGGNELVDLYAEYVNLANNLKVRKAALDMRPGIESESILDSATSGLYDDVAIGKTSGAFTSLARALMDPTGEDAAAWAKQKSDSESKKKSGLVMAGIGAIGGAVGNLLINKDAPKERSAEINAKYDKLKQSVQEVQTVVDNLPKPTCDNFQSQGVSGGTYPNCTCTDSAARFFAEQGCIACDSGMQYNEQNECVAIPPAGCKLTGILAAGKCECTTNATAENNECKCNTGYKLENGTCQAVTPPQPEPEPEAPIVSEPITLNIPADTTFDSGKSTLKQGVAQTIATALTNAINSLGADKQDAAQKISTFTISITGHTDRVPFKRGSKMNNQKLSEDRANAIKQLFVDAGVNESVITTSGKADQECTTDKYPQRDDERCRRVNVKINVTSDGQDASEISIGDLASKLTSK